MKQIIQSLSDGQTSVEIVPMPAPRPGELLIATRHSLISAGTERMLVEFGRANLLEKARKQPEKTRAVLEKIHADGVLPTLEAVRTKLQQPLALGYCNVGMVEEVGKGVRGFSSGDRVVSNGPHAEFVAVPSTLAAKVPDAVKDLDAVFVPLCAVALQGLRLAAPTLGECFVVIGLGVVGLLSVQLLVAQGCRVLAVDKDASKVRLAKRFGAEGVSTGEGQDAVDAAWAFSRGRGADGVLLTLSSSSSEPVSQAAGMCRKRGRVVLVGTAKLHLNRDDFYAKELTFQVSCSYGPGRYDPAYEAGGLDYPIGFVRWTAQRNFEAVLDLMAVGVVSANELISHRVAFANAQEAYELLSSGRESYLGMVLDYGSSDSRERTVELPVGKASAKETKPEARVAVIGAGNYAGRVLIPNLLAAGASPSVIVSTGGLSASHFGRKFGFRKATTDVSVALDDPDVDAVVIATRHDSHAQIVLAALAANKHAFVEKPLALSADEISKIETRYEGQNLPILMVGFNRRFAPQTRKMVKLLRQVAQPKAVIITVNAGAISSEHWSQSVEKGGGRIVGEACHFIDLMRHLIGHPITDFHAVCMGATSADDVREDKASITLRFQDGSFGTIHYLANGSRAFPKERVEVFCGGAVLQLDNFRRMKGWGWKGFREMNLWRQDKGHRACAEAFVNAVKQGSEAPISFDQILEVSRVTIEIGEALRL